MSPQASKQTVLVSMVALIAIAAYRDKGSPSYKRVWGVGVLGVMLSIMSDFAPAIAGPFAVLTVLGSLTNGGTQAIDNLLGGVSGQVGKAAGGASTKETQPAKRP